MVWDRFAAAGHTAFFLPQGILQHVRWKSSNTAAFYNEYLRKSAGHKFKFQV